MLRLARSFAFFVSLVLALTVTHQARADSAAAQALFDQGKKLMGEKKYAEACPKFEESQKLDPGLGTQTNLAICYEALGKTASAWSLYLEVASQAKATNQLDREKKARDAAKTLEPKLSKLIIEVPKPADGIDVKRDGTDVAQPMWGAPIPVDPGEIKITAVAPGKKLWETTVKIEKPGETTVTVPELEKGQPPPGYYTSPTATATGYGYGAPPPPLPPRMKRRSGGLFGGGIAAVCVGGLLTLGGIFAVAISATASEFGDDGGMAPSVGVLAGGLVLVGGGAAMIAIGGKKVPVEPGDGSAEPQPKPQVASPVPEVRVGLGSLSAQWQF